MNINLIYQGKNYNFSLRKEVNLKYIKDLTSRLINKDWSSFDLFYKNDSLSDYKETTLLKDLAKDDNNISIIINQKEKMDFTSTEKIKKIRKIRDFEQSKKITNINNLKFLLNSPSPSISPINSKNKINNVESNCIQNIKSKKSLEYISENKVFEDVYNLKENEIFSLMKNLSQKIKEYDAILYKNLKNNSKNIIFELSLFEKNIIDFKDKQINFLKKLLDYFDKAEKTFISGNIPLKEFYSDLKQYNNQKTIIVCKHKDNNKNNEINNSISCNSNSKKNISKTKIREVNYDRNNNNVLKKLPLLENNKVKSDKNFMSQNNDTIHSDNINENNSDFEDEEKLFKGHKFNNDIKNVINKKRIKILNKTEKNIIKNSIILQNNKDDKNNNNNFNKALSLCNTNDNSNTSQNTIIQGKKAMTNIINNKKSNSKHNLLNISKSVKNQSLNTIINSKIKNRKDFLFEEEQNKKDNNDNNSSNLSQSKVSKDDKDNSNKNEEESNYIFEKTNKSKREKSKKKKIGKNIYDFIF